MEWFLLKLEGFAFEKSEEDVQPPCNILQILDSFSFLNSSFHDKNQTFSKSL